MACVAGLKKENIHPVGDSDALPPSARDFYLGVSPLSSRQRERKTKEEKGSGLSGGGFFSEYKMVNVCE